jgi:conjugal transfer pilus assembly protein TraB
MRVPNWITGGRRFVRQHKGLTGAVGAVVVILVLRSCTAPVDSGERTTTAASPVQAVVTERQSLESRMGELQTALTKREEGDKANVAALRAVQESLASAERQKAEQQTATERLIADLDRRVQAAVAQALAKQPRAGQTTATPAAKSVAFTPSAAPTMQPSFTPGKLFEMRTLRPEHAQTRPMPPAANAAQIPYLPKGCFAQVRVVGGVMATSQVSGDTWGNPVFVTLITPFTCPWMLGGPGLPPKPTTVELDGAFALGKGKADMSASRVQVLAEDLSFVLPNGHASESSIKAYLIGSDGRQGLPGKLERHESYYVMRAFMAGLIQEAGKLLAVAKSQVVFTSTGTQSFGGIESTLDKVATYWLEQARALSPTLTVDSGETGYLVLLEGFALPDYPTATYLAKGLY